MMKYIVLYSSRTGLTKRIARSIADALPAGTPCLPVLQAPADIASDDCLFLGCWMHADEPDQIADEVLHQIRNSHLALFVSLHGTLFSDTIAKKLHHIVEKLPDGIAIEGTFITSMEEDMISSDANLEFAKTFAENTLDRLER